MPCIDGLVDTISSVWSRWTQELQNPAEVDLQYCHQDSLERFPVQDPPDSREVSIAPCESRDQHDEHEGVQ